MTRESLSRRQFGTAAALTIVGLAGCSDDETAAEDDGDDDPFELDNPGDLTIFLENEDGDAVSTGIEVVVENEDEDFSSTYPASEIEDGELLPGGLIYEGEYTVTVESTDDEFDAVEETVTLEAETDEEVTISLEGATPDSEIDDDDE